MGCGERRLEFTNAPYLVGTVFLSWCKGKGIINLLWIAEFVSIQPANAKYHLHSWVGWSEVSKVSAQGYTLPPGLPHTPLLMQLGQGE